MTQFPSFINLNGGQTNQIQYIFFFNRWLVSSPSPMPAQVWAQGARFLSVSAPGFSATWQSRY